MNEFERLLYAAQAHTEALQELKETNQSLAFMTGVGVGVIGTLFSAGVFWLVWWCLR